MSGVAVASSDREGCGRRIIRSIDFSRLPAVLKGFEDRGESVRGWAIARGFNPSTVYNVLSGTRPCLRGEQHRIAVALGLKDCAGG